MEYLYTDNDVMQTTIQYYALNYIRFLVVKQAYATVLYLVKVYKTKQKHHEIFIPLEEQSKSSKGSWRQGISRKHQILKHISLTWRSLLYILIVMHGLWVVDYLSLAYSFFS